MFMTALSYVMNGLLTPFGALPPWVGLAFVSLLAAMGTLLAIRATSDQAQLTAVRRSLRACMYELRLFRDDLPAIARIVAEGMRLNLKLLRLSLAPVLWLIVPFVLLTNQLQSFYGYSGLELGQPAIVKVQLKDTAATGDRPRLTVSPAAGLRVETTAVWIASLREAAWRVVADRPGLYDAIVEYRGETVTKRVAVSDTAAARSPFRGAGIVNQLLYPAEPALPAASRFASIAVTYQPRSVRVFGQDVHWSVLFFGLSCAFTLALRRRFGVTL